MWLQRRIGIIIAVDITIIIVIFYDVALFPDYLLGSPTGPPKVVGLIDLNDASASSSVLQQCLAAADWKSQSSPYQFNAQFTALKTRCTFIVPSSRTELVRLLEVSKISDVLLLVLSVSDDQTDLINAVSFDYTFHDLSSY